ncbi:hypothetical protein F2P56_015177 [Juglans regia]|uniref:Uncharacterized protein n=2 Tax=Juglans regia TaxID=51240 RepID=A0A833XEM8_JUGRE|nr:uncharacterized protein LOC108982638 [Juglans regia]KAF5465146.1 hypothetical protein F2P56_015177 [Juglans regia]
MGIMPDCLRLVTMLLKGFIGDVFQPIGGITLSILVGKTLGEWQLPWFVVKVPSSYNAILGRPTLNHLRVVTSTFHLKMKFPTPTGVGEIRSKQVLARECYSQEMKPEGIKVRAHEGVREDVGPPPALTLMELEEEVRDEKAL